MRVENVKGAVWTVDEVEFYKRRPQRCPSGAAGIGAGLAQVAGYVSRPSPAKKNRKPRNTDNLHIFYYIVTFSTFYIYCISCLFYIYIIYITLFLLLFIYFLYLYLFLSVYLFFFYCSLSLSLSDLTLVWRMACGMRE